MFSGKFLNRILNLIGLKVSIPFERHIDKFDQDFFDIHKKCEIYTMTSFERMYLLYNAVKYIVKQQVPGDLVECGVWRGGSSMVMAHTLMKMNETTRKVYLYDTYTGMAKPMDRDVDFLGRSAIKEWAKNKKGDFNKWAYSSLEETKGNLFKTSYPKDNLVFVQGKVEDTIPETIPDKIAILRLDNDWFEPTYHELSYLFPRLSVNGVIIIDDYDFLRGQRESVDKYFAENNINILLSPIDGAGRVGIKVEK